MGDSDDEHDRSRERDKFRRERSDYGSGDKGRSSRSDSYRDRRSTWREERRRSRDEYDSDSKRRSGGYGRGRDWSPPPPPKRARRAEWQVHLVLQIMRTKILHGPYTFAGTP